MARLFYIPRWVWAAALGLAALEPAAYLCFEYAIPQGSAPTGMRIQDDALFRVSMRMAESGFYSPYAPPDAPLGPHSIHYFRTPYYWLYGAVGLARWALGLDEFIALGIANGIGALLYLLAVFIFFREAAPRLANSAFLLFILAGGCGGVLYGLSLAMGWTSAPGFEDAFRRFAVYQLIEGAYIYPYLQISRLYYTIPLAMGFLGLTLFWRWLKGNGSQRGLWASGLLLFAACWINQRLGPLFWAAAICYSLSRNGRPWRQAWTGHAAWGMAIGASSLASWAMMTPQFKASTEHSNAATIWLTPFVCAACLHLLLIPRAIQRGIAAITPACAIMRGSRPRLYHRLHGPVCLLPALLRKSNHFERRPSGGGRVGLGAPRGLGGRYSPVLPAACSRASIRFHRWRRLGQPMVSGIPGGRPWRVHRRMDPSLLAI